MIRLEGTISVEDPSDYMASVDAIGLLQEKYFNFDEEMKIKGSVPVRSGEEVNKKEYEFSLREAEEVVKKLVERRALKLNRWEEEGKETRTSADVVSIPELAYDDARSFSEVYQDIKEDFEDEIDASAATGAALGAIEKYLEERIEDYNSWGLQRAPNEDSYNKNVGEDALKEVMREKDTLTKVKDYLSSRLST